MSSNNLHHKLMLLKHNLYGWTRTKRYRSTAISADICPIILGLLSIFCVMLVFISVAAIMGHSNSFSPNATLSLLLFRHSSITDLTTAVPSMLVTHGVSCTA